VKVFFKGKKGALRLGLRREGSGMKEVLKPTGRGGTERATGKTWIFKASCLSNNKTKAFIIGRARAEGASY
jgi:hypothetical protein